MSVPLTSRRATNCILLAALLGVLVPARAPSQTLDARRLGMGGVVTSDMGAAADANIAFRAVPKGRGHRSFGLPLGLIQFLANPPQFDTAEPDFNAFELADLVTNPPLTLSIGHSEAPSSDVHIYVAQDSLAIDLEDLRRIVPESSLRNGGVTHLPGIGFGIRRAFVHVGPIVHVQNQFDLEEPFRAVLRDAAPFTTQTRYGLSDLGVAQAAIAFQVGVAQRLLYGGAAPGEGDEGDDDPRRNGATALYVGAAPKYLFGLAYGDLRGGGGATTSDTLFGSNDPVAIDAMARTRHAVVGGDGGSGHGFGADVGAVLYYRNFEFGVGLNDLVSTIDWKVTERTHAYDDALDEFVTTPLATDRAFTSRIPVTTTVGVARRIGGTTVAAGVIGGPLSTSLHLGAEKWLGMLAVRAGTYRDSNKNWQVTGGGGVRFGKIGIDLAFASHQRYIEEARAAEMVASLTLY
jgi:hypothetical protein